MITVEGDVNVIATASEVHPKYRDLKYPLSRHMEHWRHRHAWTQRFPATSEQSRLDYIAYYLWDVIGFHENELYIDDIALLSDLNEHVAAYGPITIFWHHIWQKHFRSSFDIYSEDGYYGFITHLVVTELRNRNLPIILFTDLMVAELHAIQPGFHNPVITRPIYQIWKSSETYQRNYSDISNNAVRDALTIDLIFNLMIDTKLDLLIAPELERYWTQPHSAPLPAISRFVLICASISLRFQRDLREMRLSRETAEAIAVWWRDEVLPFAAGLERFAPGLTVQHMSFDIRAGRRLGIPRNVKGYPRPGSIDKDIDVLVIGPIGAASGLGSGARRTIGALQKAGVDYRVLPSFYNNPATVQPGAFGKAEYAGERPRAVIWHYNAEYLPDVLTTMPEFEVCGKQIAYYFWEMSAIPEALHLGCDVIDEIWVPSEFCREAFAVFPTPVVNVGSSIELPKVGSYLTRETLGISPTAFVVMFSFDSHSVIHRKNPAAVVRAFKQAFPEDEDVLLLLKTQNWATAHWNAVLSRGEELLELCSSDSRIRFFDKTSSLLELYSMKNCSDVYMSLHRSEGYGYGPAEAMALGKPVIMTNYSANVEFATEDNCLLVNAPLIHITAPEYLYTEPGMMWGEPNVDEAAQKLRALYDDRELARHIGERARETINRDHGVDAMAARVKARLIELGIVRKER